MRRTASKPTPPPERDWSHARAKVAAEGACRVCGRESWWHKIEAAHVIGRAHDKRERLGGPLVVQARDVVPLCADHHRAYDARQLDLLPYLRLDEQAAAVAHVGIVAALRRLTSGAA